MNKIAVIILFVFACTLPSLAQSSNTQGHDWSGGYVGGNGYGSSDQVGASSTLLVTQISNLFQNNRGLIVVPGFTTPFAATKRTTKWGGGGQAGYQWQSGSGVFGVEGDFDPFHRTASASQSQQVPSTALAPVSTINMRRDVRLSSEFTIRGRGGYSFGSNLVYGTGGYATARARVSSIDSYTNPGGSAATGVCGINNTPCQFNSTPEGPVVTSANESHSMGGWTAGGGFDHAFSKRYSIGVEYRHTSLGSKSFTLNHQTTVNTGPETHGDNGATGLLGSVSTGPTTISLRSDAVSFRFNFHF